MRRSPYIRTIAVILLVLAWLFFLLRPWLGKLRHSREQRPDVPTEQR